MNKPIRSPCVLIGSATARINKLTASIDPQMMNKASRNFARYSTDEIDELTRKYLVSVGLGPTKERIKKTRPSIEQMLAEEPLLGHKVAFIDTQLVKL